MRLRQRFVCSILFARRALSLAAGIRHILSFTFGVFASAGASEEHSNVYALTPERFILTILRQVHAAGPALCERLLFIAPVCMTYVEASKNAANCCNKSPATSNSQHTQNAWQENQRELGESSGYHASKALGRREPLPNRSGTLMTGVG